MVKLEQVQLVIWQAENGCKNFKFFCDVKKN